MRVSCWLIVLLSVAVAHAENAANRPAGTTTCTSCHASQAMTQTPMALALALPGKNPTLEKHPKLSVRKGAYTYTVETHGSESTYKVSDGTHTVSLPIHWSFGAGGQTWVFEREGRFYESLVSFYPAIDGLDTTIGDESLVPHNIEEAYGRLLTDVETKACFGCHATNTLMDGRLNLDSLKPGVQCERCHTGAATHMAEAPLKKLTSLPQDLGDLSSESISNYCGQCHRTWETVVRNRWRGEMNVRFQPYRLANSKCFNGSDPRISCLACHEPHHDVTRGSSQYDAKCLACHASSASLVPTEGATAKACPVAKTNCTSCHMPKVKLPGEGSHLTLTDHQIRIVRPGGAYPN